MLSVALFLIHLVCFQVFFNQNIATGDLQWLCKSQTFFKKHRILFRPVLQEKRSEARLSAGNFVSIFNITKVLHAAKATNIYIYIFGTVFQIKPYLSNLFACISSEEYYELKGNL